MYKTYESLNNEGFLLLAIFELSFKLCSPKVSLRNAFKQLPVIVRKNTNQSQKKKVSAFRKSIPANYICIPSR